MLLDVLEFCQPLVIRQLHSVLAGQGDCCRGLRERRKARVTYEDGLPQAEYVYWQLLLSPHRSSYLPVDGCRDSHHKFAHAPLLPFLGDILRECRHRPRHVVSLDLIQG